MLKVGVPLALGAGLLGMSSGVGSSIREGMMETAFGDPNADAAFLGRNVSARFLLGSAMGGPLGNIMQYSAPDDQFMLNPVRPTAGSTFAGGAIGGTLGAVIGGKIGGVRAGIAGGILGAIGGGVVAPAGYTMGHINRNSEFYSRSPYRSSRQLAEELNASGNIVLGMHNSRGGM